MQEILLPKMGNSVEEAEIVKWFKQEGEPVETGEALFSIQTDKAEVECESTASGVLRKILVPEGVEVPVLTVIALVGTADEPLPDLSQYGAGGSVPMAVQSEITVASVTPTPQSASVQPVPAGKVPVSPRARKAAAARGIDAAALAGSGVGGRVLEADVLAAAPESAAKITPTAKRMIENAGIAAAGIAGTGIGGKITKADVSQALAKPAAPAPAAAPGVASLQRVPLTPMRRIIAERMSASKYSAPHYYVTVEVDMKGAREFRARNKAFKASFNDLVLFATAKALREFPNVNARWLGDAIEQGGDVNLGMAVALPTGLIVPVIRQAHLLSLEGLCAASKALAEKAQTGKLLPDDYQGNTFTVSNLGAYGVDHFTAIINQPDSAILAIGQIKDRVVVIDGGIHIRPIMKLTLSSDHRVVDGAVAAQFMGRLKAILEEAAF
ncbi:MAG TPA: dihydrolipoamide acetyltransferase family protein [Candidatus Hydrogenedentes bacterium]|jgi:pyruvate dehydrogenase E2 component (dihydrolipoamide acetyltransferase)|nr:MAG: Dihydrolipoyllysine-residue acetyltransferase component of pyruvate dehydrogenase complex [Candidatus Hydrogenedentes bacterium ADurb.Bin101]HOC70006.1 dihydrolipoamide acetyltransferase family protein [Candidatus Hydrogenedentota bacterium]HQN00401.1 dihydrolipoamide acetyltransferase family protein [Candidatus Hydrogenedentota bacterium]